MFEVAGTLEPAPSGVRVRLRARNAGEASARDLRVHAELLGEKAAASVGDVVAPGTDADALLDLPRVVTVTGVHALALRLDYESVRGPGGPAEALSQWAYLLVAFGAAPRPAVHLELPNLAFAETARLPVKLRSADGRRHRVRLSLHVPRVLAAVPHAQVVEVPAAGEVAAEVRLFRGASEARSHGVLALAATEDEGPVSTAAATAVIVVAPDPALLPRLGLVLPGAAALLIAAAAVAQWRRGVLRSPTV